MQSRRLFIFNNLFLAFTGVLAIIFTLTVGSRAARLDGTGPYYLQILTFTLLSNLFLSCVATVAAIMTIFRQPLGPRFATWYFTAATATLVTFLTVVFFLAPMRAAAGKNYFDMLLGPMFFLHFLNPLLGTLAYLTLDAHHPTAAKFRLLATLPVVIYGAFYFITVVLVKSLPDIYGLTFGGRYYLTPLVFLVFWLLAFGLANFLIALQTRRA